MEREKILFTSESVTEGHPDKMCDQISDAILDELMKQDPMSRVACETCTTTGYVMVMGEITSNAHIDFQQVVRDTVREIGYDRAKYGFDADTCAVVTAIDKQSTDIAMGVDKALEAKESNMMKVIVSVRSGDNDQQEQDEIVEEMIDAGCDVLCVNLVDRTAPSNIVRMARQNDIPVIFFNREPVQEDLLQWDKLFYVGCDAAQSGEMQGEIAAEYIKNHPEVDKNGDGKIQYVLLEGEAGHQDAISRTDLSVKTMIENEIELEKLSYQFADWNRAQAENRVSQLIDQYGSEIELILSNNDEMALGAVEAYKNAGYRQVERPIIFGIDGLTDALEAVEHGTMQGTVYNDKEDQARMIALLTVALFQGSDIEGYGLEDDIYYMSQYRKVDADNVDTFLGK